MDDKSHQCPGCLYDLRGRALDSEFCPECGAFLAPPDPADPGRIPGMVLRRTLQSDDRGILIRNANVPAGVVQRHLKAAARRTELWFALGVGGCIVSLVAIYSLGLVLNELGTLPYLLGDHPIMCFALLAAMHYAIYRIVVKSWLVDRAITRRVRRSLRREGYDLCEHCGWQFGDAADCAATCPHCHRPHAPSPRPATDPPSAENT